MRVELSYQSDINNVGKNRLSIRATDMSYDDIEELIFDRLSDGIYFFKKK